MCILTLLHFFWSVPHRGGVAVSMAIEIISFLYPDTKRISATVPHGKPHFTLNITLVIYTDCTTVIKSNRIGASGCPGGSDRHYTPNGLAYLESIIVVTLYCITTHKKRQTLKVCLFTKSYFNFISIDLWLTGNACFLLL